MRKVTWHNILAMILAFALLVSSVPMQVFALVGDTLEDDQLSADAVVSPILTEASAEDKLREDTIRALLAESYVISEDESRRGENYKEYILSSGIRLATVYPAAVHYEANGEWREFDNTLISAITEGRSVYTNTAGPWDIQFPQNLSSGSMIGITTDGYTVQFGMAGELRSTGGLVVASAGQVGNDTISTTLSVSAALPSVAQIEQIDLTEALTTAQYPETVLDKLNSRLSYANVFANTDVIYDLQGGQLKESIVLQQYDASLCGYRYNLDVGGLVPVLGEDQQIDLCDPATGVVVLTMPAPYMVDDNGDFNDDVEVSLVRNGDSYLLSYYLPTEWLAEENRAWPVILDPIVTKPGRYDIVDDRTFRETKEDSVTRGVIVCGCTVSNGKMRFLMRFMELPKLTSADTIINATISLKQAADYDTSKVVEVHKVTGSWESTENLTWSSLPAIDNSIEDYAVCQLAQRYEWNITDIVRGWYDDENTGMMFKASDEIEESGEGNWVQFYSSDYGTSTSVMPMLTITYQTTNGLESYWDYTSASAGRAGTGYVQNYSGNLVWVHSDIGFDGNRMPVSISHVYNAESAWDAENEVGINMFGLGNGWRTNFHQTIEDEKDDEGNTYYIWEDGDGTRHDFFIVSDGKYADADNLGLTLTVSTSGVTITDKYNNYSSFDDDGRLVEQTNNQQMPSSIRITYVGTSYRISKIKDGVGRTYKFTYDEDNLLLSITYYGSVDPDESAATENPTVFGLVEFQYTNANLTSIKYADGLSSKFTYTTKNKLSVVEDVDGYRLTFDYNSLENHMPSRVASISESFLDKTDNTVSEGSATTIEYAYRYTTIRKEKVNDTDEDVFQTYFFNEWGNTISVQDSEGNAVFYQYGSGVKNRLTAASQEQNTTPNLISDSSFENGTTWKQGEGTTSQLITSQYSYSGALSLKSTYAGKGGGRRATRETFDVWEGEALTFSAYVKTLENSKVKLQITDDLGTIVESETLQENSNWTRLVVTYTNDTDASREISISLYHISSGTAYMDCAQLEKNEIAGHYNLLYGDDYTQRSIWTSYSSGSSAPYATTIDTTVPNMDTYCFCIEGDPTAEQYIYQTMNCQGEADDIYVFSAWVKGNALPDIGGDRFYGLALTFNYTDGTKKEVTVSANPNLCTDSQWQYLTLFAVADKAYNSITLRAEHSYNENTVYFDGIQLYIDSIDQYYKYVDNDDKIEKTIGASGRVSVYSYIGNDLKSITTNGAPTVVSEQNEAGELVERECTVTSITSYTYDNYHNVKTYKEEYQCTYNDGTTGDSVVTSSCSYTYDQYGNVLTQSSSTDNETMGAVFTYQNVGNHLKEAIDELGNKTTYQYNADTSVLEWVRYPLDSESTRTTYEYDAMYRLTSATTTTNYAKTMTAVYSYQNDNISQIETGSTAYSFDYGDFGLRSAVAIGERNLASYQYTSDKQIKELAYGNGHVVEYKYDEYGRVTEELYKTSSSDAAIRTITYTYDKNGNLTDINDTQGNGSNVVTQYTYGQKGRVHNVTETGNGISHGIWYVYDLRGLVTSMQERHGSNSSVYRYFYDGSGRVHALEYSASANSNAETIDCYVYDGLGRVVGKETYHNNVRLITRGVIYYSGNGTTSSRVKDLEYTYGTDGTLEYTYTYDQNGNIVSVEYGDYVTDYVYDSANQLVRENNEEAGKTWVMSYDNAGNLVHMKEYAYSTGATIVPEEQGSYYYTDSEWGDLLTGYNNKTLTYDTIGNLTSDGDWSYTWTQGRRLATMSSGGTTWTYTYDANGMRTKRTSGSTTYTYTYNGGKLSSMTCGSDVLYFSYDAAGNPLTVTYGGATYYYVVNLQGDVVAILNSSGVQVAGYVYNAWGKLISTTGSMSPTLGLHNPLRYRGYVYDQDTGLYYLQSRYYDPTWGRFISADNVIPDAGGEVLGYNLFAYCMNNPVNMSDVTGQFPVALAVMIGVAVVGIINNTINALYYEQSDGVSEITSSSYQDERPTRFEKIDFAKQETGDEHYFINAWRYYNEYTVHEVGWFLTKWAYGKEIPVVSEAAYQFSVADVYPHDWDYWAVNVATVIWGVLGF